MSTPLEQQTDEREALQSIYEGDPQFKEIDATTFQYKVSHMDENMTGICLTILLFFFKYSSMARRMTTSLFSWNLSGVKSTQMKPPLLT